MSMVANAYITNHNLDQAKIVHILTTGFSRTLCGWWEKYLIEDSRESIKKIYPFLMKEIVKVSLMESIL